MLPIVLAESLGQKRALVYEANPSIPRNWLHKACQAMLIQLESNAATYFGESFLDAHTLISKI